MATTSVGILGTGLYLPEAVRDNSWWPEEVTARWPPMIRFDLSATSDDERMVIAALERHRGDPFQGARLRHVVDDAQSAMELEVLAARDAIANAGIAPSDIQMLLTHSAIPDYLSTNTACSVHERVGLPSACFTLAVEASSNSFLMQAALAEHAIRAGAVRHALLVQACTFSRVLPQEAEYSAWIGDAATAVVLGPVAPGHGFLSWQHRADGSLENTFVTGIPGRRWYDEGRPIGYPANPGAARRMFSSLVTPARDAGLSALAAANVTPEQIAFFASHHGTSWFRAVTQEALGLTNAKFVDSFPDVGNVYSANIPLGLHLARRDGLLAHGDLVLMFSGGGGTTYSCGVMRWAL